MEIRSSPSRDFASGETSKVIIFNPNGSSHAWTNLQEAVVAVGSTSSDMVSLRSSNMTAMPDPLTSKTMMLSDDEQCFKVGSFAIINTRPSDVEEHRPLPLLQSTISSSPNSSPVVCVDMCPSPVVTQQGQNCLSVSSFPHSLSVPSDSAKLDQLNEISVVPIVSEDSILQAKKGSSSAQTMTMKGKKNDTHSVSQPHILSASQINQLVEDNHRLSDTPSLLNYDAPSFSLSDVVYTTESIRPISKKLPECTSPSNLFHITSKEHEDLVEEVACFKCRLCSFLNLDKARVLEHVEMEHGNECLNDEDPSSNRVTCAHCSKRFISLKSLMIHFKDKHPGQPYEYVTKRKKIKKGKIDDQGESLSDPSDSLLAQNIKQQNTFVSSDDDTRDLQQVDVEPKKSTETSLPPELPCLDSTNKSDPPTISKHVKRRGRPRGSKNLGITNLKKMKICPDKSILEKELGFKCEINGCAVRMKISENILYHRRCHNGNEYKCPECEDKHTNWRNMSVHLWRSHVIDMELYSCDQCSFKTYSISKLEKLHKRIHSSDRPCLCDTCGKGFKTPKQLRNHKSIHSKGRLPGGKGYEAGMPECEMCHRRFSDCRMLRIHRDTVHMKKKPFLCNYCGYSASSCSTLKLHMRQHTGEKPFMCTMCSYKTSDHNSLRRHTMRHLGKKQYKCPHCSYECIQASTYKAHLKNKHPGQDEGFMFSCHLCRFRTVKKENFMSHVVLHSEQNEKQSKEKVETCPDEINSKDETFLPTTTHTLLFSPLEEVHTQGFSTSDTMEFPRHFLCQVMPEGLDHSQIGASPMLHVVQDGREIQVAPTSLHEDKAPA